MNKQHHFIYLLSCLFSYTILGNSTSYQKIGSLALQAEDILKINIKQPTKEKPKNIRDTDLTTKEMSVIEKKELIYNLFEEHKSLLPQESAITIDGIAELNLISGDPLTKKTNLLNRIKRTKTVFGDVTMAYLLCHPTNNRELLNQRQAAIRELVSNENLLAQCDILLNEIKNNESSLLLFWEKEDESRTKILEHVYFGDRLSRFNSNPYALEASRVINYTLKSINYLHPLSIINAALALGNSLFNAGVNGDPLVSKELVKAPAHALWHTNKQAFLEHRNLFSLDEQYRKYRSDIRYAESVGSEVPDLVKTKRFFYCTKLVPLVAIDIWWLWNATQATQNLSFYNRVLSMLHKQINGAAKVYQSIKGISELVTHNELLQQGLQTRQALTIISEKPHIISAQLNSLCKLLTSSTLSSAQRNASFVGRALAAYHIMPKVKEHFVGALEAIGELDALVSIAKLVKENSDTQTPYCFTQFIEQEAPEVALTHFWNPLIESPTADSLHLGNSNQIPNILLTGPHGCGKSTAMKAIAYSLILSQTFGIAAAKEAHITIFDTIHTYLNIKENVDQKMSTFMAESLRIDQISTTLMSIKPKHKSFVIMDEALKGTMEEEGAQRLYEFGKKIFNLPNNLCIMATHFEKVSDLEQDLTNRVRNYHVGLEEPELGSFVRTYQLIPGKNQWWFEDAHKRGRFIDWLTNSTK